MRPERGGWGTWSPLLRNAMPGFCNDNPGPTNDTGMKSGSTQAGKARSITLSPSSHLRLPPPSPSFPCFIFYWLYFVYLSPLPPPLRPPSPVCFRFLHVHILQPLSCPPLSLFLPVSDKASHLNAAPCGLSYVSPLQLDLCGCGV